MLAWTKIWPLFWFGDPIQEHSYRLKQARTQKPFVVLFCLVPLISLAIQLPQHPSDVVPYWILISCATMLSIVLALTLALPYMRLHILTVCAAAFVFMLVGAGFASFRQAKMMLHRDQEMSFAWDAVANCTAAYDQLEQNVERLTTDGILLTHVWILLGSGAILAVMGLNLWTLAATLMLPVVYYPVVAVLCGVGLGPGFTVTCLGVMYESALAFLIAYFRRNRFRSECEDENTIAQALEESAKLAVAQHRSLKESMVDATGCLKLFSMPPREDDAEPDHLKTSQDSLLRGIQACDNVQTYLRLCAGTYERAVGQVQLYNFVQKLMAGRRIVASYIAPLVVRMDPDLCALVLDNALANAVKHADPLDPDVRFWIMQDDDLSEASDMASVGAMSEGQLIALRFHVSNRVHPERPFLRDVKFDEFLASGEVSGLTKLSNRIGLQCMQKGAEAQQMDFTMEAVGDRVVFEARLDVEKLAGQQPTGDSSSERIEDLFPVGLRFYCIDGTESHRR